MNDWAIVDLVGQRNWDPDALMLTEFEWPVPWPVIPLVAFTLSLKPDTEARAGTPVITLAGFDPVTGALKTRSRKYEGLAYRVGEQEDGLRPGDILIPPTDGPVLLINQDLVGSLVSARYVALRSFDIPGLWIWAVLNSASGRTARKRITRSFERGITAARLRLRETPIPLAPLAEIAEKLPLLEWLERATHSQEEEAKSSWWTTADLTGMQWHHVLATPNPERLMSGEPLASYCIWIVRGARVGADASTAHRAGLLPVATGQVLAGRAVRNYVPEDAAPVIAEPGDVLVGAIGERANARIVSQQMAVASTVYLLRPRTSDLGPKLVRFLNGTEGLARRRIANRSQYAPRINLNELRQLRIPVGALEAEEPPEIGPLDQQLEELLWPN